MKPRRWYSSPEMNPSPAPYVVPFASLTQLTYAARTYLQQGPIIRLIPTEPKHPVAGHDPQAPVASAGARRIDAA
jgi:hypothetical protein